VESNEVRYVCLSDLHLGQESSLLTGVGGDVPPLDGPVPVLEGLAERLADLVGDQTKKPTLVLLGDALEFALASDNVAAMAFERFVDLTFNRGRLFDGIIYVPGNHDHHLWESARETQYVENYLGVVRSDGKSRSREGPGLGTALEPSWHTSSMFILEKDDRRVDMGLVRALIHRFPELEEIPVLGAYPHLARRTPDGSRAVVFHHGHLLEDLYRLMSNLQWLLFGGEELDRTLDEIEAENFAWIDFFWSTMGRSGRSLAGHSNMGEGIEILYEIASQRPKQLRDYVAPCAERVAKKYNKYHIPLVPIEFFEEKAGDVMGIWLCRLIGNAVGGHRRVKGEAFDDELKTAILTHLRGPLARALADECVKHSAPPYPSRLPNDLTFVTGHTHKPYSRLLPVKPDLADAWAGNDSLQPVKLYNLGGWTVDAEKADSLHGAAALLLDEDLNAAYVRLYNEPEHEDGQVAPVRVEELLREGETTNAFCEGIAAALATHLADWTAWSRTVGDARKARARQLSERLDAAHRAAAGVTVAGTGTSVAGN
jgi:hypothetical protein